MNIIKILKKAFNLRMANRSYSSKIKWLEKEGTHLGKNVRLNCNVECFGTEPYLITISDDCLIASEVHFITHDGGIKVLNHLKYFDDKCMDAIAPIRVGCNTYIGTGAYILPGVTIGNNCIIGAAAVVTKSIPDNSVAVGIPAKVIETIDIYSEHLNEKHRLHETAKMCKENKKQYFLKTMK